MNAFEFQFDKVLNLRAETISANLIQTVSTNAFPLETAEDFHWRLLETTKDFQ